MSSIAQVDLLMGGSGAIDNLIFQPVPEPGTLALIAAGLALLSLRPRLG